MTNEIALVVVAAIGVAGTLAGSFVGPFFSRRHEFWKAKREDEQLIREKAQELFDELDRVAKAAGASSTRALERLQNEKLEVLPFPDLGRIRAIAALYFPTTMPRIESFESDYAESLKSSVEKLSGKIESGDADADYIKGLMVVMATTSQQIANQFVRDLRSELSKGLPRFELLEQHQ